MDSEQSFEHRHEQPPPSKSGHTTWVDWVAEYKRRLAGDGWATKWCIGVLTPVQLREEDDTTRQAKSDDICDLIGLMEYNPVTRHWLSQDCKRERIVACLTSSGEFEEGFEGFETLVFEGRQRVDHTSPLADLTADFDEFLEAATDAQRKEDSPAPKGMSVGSHAYGVGGDI